jgi:hypothetical protein
MITKIFITLGFVFFSFAALSQQRMIENAEMADVMRSNGKIYVVIAVMLTILAGLILYLIKLDKRMTRFEKEQMK